MPTPQHSRTRLSKTWCCRRVPRWVTVRAGSAPAAGGPAGAAGLPPLRHGTGADSLQPLCNGCVWGRGSTALPSRPMTPFPGTRALANRPHQQPGTSCSPPVSRAKPGSMHAGHSGRGSARKESAGGCTQHPSPPPGCPTFPFGVRGLELAGEMRRRAPLKGLRAERHLQRCRGRPPKRANYFFASLSILCGVHEL